MNKDSNAEIRKLYIEPTSACNLSCKMCFRHSWLDEEIGTMTDKTFENIAQYMSQYCPETAFFGGMGEPLIHKQIAAMVGTAARYCKNVELITNCTCLTEELARALLDNGLTRLWVSMDGFSADEYEKIRLGGQFEKICKNLEVYNRLRQNTAAGLGFTFVVMNDNIHQLQLIDSFADKLDADIINISHAIPSSPDAAAREFYKQNIPVGKMHRLSEGADAKPPEYCPFVQEKMCFVKWDGSVVPCMQLLHSSKTYMYDLERRVWHHSFGNVCDKPLQDIYQSRRYTEFRSRVEAFDFPTCTLCEGCELREENIEDCMFNEKPTCGACLWATGKVFCP